MLGDVYYVSLPNITDGSSNTVMVGENAGQPLSFVFGQLQTVSSGVLPYSNMGIGYPTADFGWADPGGSFSINGADPTTGAICKNHQTTTTSSPGAGQVWNATTSAYGAISGSATANINANNNGEIYSFHTGGANLLLADGSVHFVGQTVTAPVFAAIFTMRGNEAGINNPW